MQYSQNTSRFLLFLSLGCLLIITGCRKSKNAGVLQPDHKATSQSKQLDPKAMIPKPFVEIFLKTQNCGVLVSINGSLMLIDYSGIPYEMASPVNHLLRNGDNEFTVYVSLPPSNEMNIIPRLEFSIKIRAFHESTDVAKVLATIVYDGVMAKNGSLANASSQPGQLLSSAGFQRSTQGDVIVGPVKITPLPSSYNPGSVAISRTITMPLPFRPWAFLNGEPIHNLNYFMDDKKVDRKLHDALLAAYREIHQALANKDEAKLRQLFRERSEESDQALYREPGNTLSGLIAGMKEEWNNPGMRLMSLEEQADDTGEPTPYANYAIPGGKTIFFGMGDRASTILRYTPTDKASEGFDTVYPVMFRLEKGKFIVTR